MALKNAVAKTWILTFVLSIGFLFAGSVESYNNDVRNAANRLSQSTDQLVNSLQSYLQANGRWVPKPGSDDMRACNAMQELQRQANDLKARAGNMSENDLASATSRLDSNMSALERRLRSIGADKRVFSQFRNVSDDARNLMSYSRSGFGGGSYGNNGGYTPSANDINNATRALDGNVNRLVTNLQTYLQSKGKWRPPAGSNEMRACEIMQDLQKQTQSIKNVNSSNLSSNARRLSDTARDLRSQLRRIGADGTVMNQMDLVSNDIRQITGMSGDDYRGDRSYGRGRGYGRDRDYGRNYDRNSHYNYDQYNRSGRGWR